MPKSAEIERNCAIEDYALIGDCRSAALVSRFGSIDWVCLPRFDSSSIFAAMLDPARGGRFSIYPCGEFECTQSYIDGTNVAQIDFTTADGVVRLTDLFSIFTRERCRSMLYPQREILRSVECIEGEAVMEVQYLPRFEFGLLAPGLRQRGKLGIYCSHRDKALFLRSTIPLNISDKERAARGSFKIKRGEQVYFSLSFTEGEPAVIPGLGEEAARRVSETIKWWKDWISACSYSGVFAEAVRRSVLALKLLTYTPSGAVIAAPTTSLPEQIGGVRNWDYRYCWLRDASMTIEALFQTGYHDEAVAFLSWLLHTTRLTKPELRVLYDVYGRTNLTERQLDYLSGYRDSRPVRVGNAATEQLQMDIYGEVAAGAHAFIKQGENLDRTTSGMLRGLGETVCNKWRQPDKGIWEIRGEPRHHTFSKVMCWVALDRLLRMHYSNHITVPLERYSEERESIRAQVEAEGFNRQLNSYTSSYGTSDMDISLLLLPHFSYIEADNPRMVSTYELILKRLQKKGFFYRYHFEDGLPGGEGAFLIGSFWAIEYMARLGKIEEASRQFESLLGYANHVGLFSEEIEPETGAMLGNFPQAYTHVGLINAAVVLDKCSKGLPLSP